MKFSGWPATDTAYPDLLAGCQHLAATGWDGIWIADHFMENASPNHGHAQEAWTLLAGLAALVPRVRLGTLVTGNTYRNPAVLAKQAAQVDVISGGRVVLGIGAGWQENEHLAYDIPYYTVGARLRRLEEAVQIIRSLFDNEHTNFAGSFYHLRDAPLDPKPVQSHLPILIGGGGEKVTLRITARFADEWNVWGSPETLARKGSVLEQHCEEVGRDPAEIKRTAQAIITIDDGRGAGVSTRYQGMRLPTISGSIEEIREQIGRYADAKVDELIIPDFNMADDLSLRREAYDQIIEEIAPEFR